jgi:signal transduction histidine kinase/ActR/RegA family two-component response regulator
MCDLSRILDGLLPERTRTADTDTRRRARLVVGFTLALIVWSPTFGVVYHELHLPDFSAAVLFAGTLGIVILAQMRVTGSVAWSAHLISIDLFAILTYLSALSGGICSPAVAWFAAIPMLATMMVGYRAGLLWLSATLLVLTSLFVEGGAPRSAMEELDARQFAIWAYAAATGITLVVYSLTLIYEKLKDHALGTVLAANRAKSEFLTNVSHELRTPLTAILGFTGVLLEDEADRLSPAERWSRLHTIRRNGQHLLELINDILDLSKIEAGRMEVERLVVAPTRIVNDVVTLLTVRADEKDLALSAVFEGRFPATVRTDPTRLRQILINLVGNALKFTEAGSVTVTARLVNSGAANARLQFDVADTGIGMTADQLGRIFTPFTQADASCTRNYGGTGLGLAISRRLAQMLDGDITASSTPGRGSLFRLEIAAPEAAKAARPEAMKFPAEAATGEKYPRQPPPDSGMGEPVGDRRQSQPADESPAVIASRRQRSPAAGQLAGVRILLAEDGPDNRQLVGYVLRRAGGDVVIAENGRAAVDCARIAEASGRPFDVILMDMQMPVLDGYAATRELRSAGYAWPIVALTAHAMADDRQRCLEAGCDDYTTKPIKHTELVALLAHHARAAAQPV